MDADTPATLWQRWMTNSRCASELAQHTTQRVKNKSCSKEIFTVYFKITPHFHSPCCKYMLPLLTHLSKQREESSVTGTNGIVIVMEIFVSRTMVCASTDIMWSPRAPVLVLAPMFVSHRAVQFSGRNKHEVKSFLEVRSYDKVEAEGESVLCSDTCCLFLKCVCCSLHSPVQISLKEPCSGCWHGIRSPDRKPNLKL